ncbi:MAG: type III pantothenate kinase [Halioglobus sp.]|nr:type III pantothenate kinase [Halioglobus sp.]
MTAAAACLQLDVGNSSAKWRLLRGAQVIERGRLDTRDPASREAGLGALPGPGHIWISSVASPEAEADLGEWLRQRWGVQPWFARTEARTGELVNSYRDPSRMGVDRWLAMLGARARHTGRLCVVDAGSALTIDLVAADGRHEGGYIIPGPQLMERALLLDTDRVRFDEDIGYGLTPGASTAEAVRHGIALAQAGAVALALDAAGPDVPALYFCGGGGEALMGLLDRTGEWAPDLVFEGLEVQAALRDEPAR